MMAGDARGFDGSRRTAAIDYDVGRGGVEGEHWVATLARSHAVNSTGHRLLSPMALRVLSVLTGWWIAMGNFRCRPLHGVHPDGCAHRLNRVDYTLAALACDLSGHSGGSQSRLISEALDELAHATNQYRVETAAGAAREVSHVLSLRVYEPGSGPGRATGYIVWDPLHLERLLAGRFQMLPPHIVSGLSREADVRLWYAVINHPFAVGAQRSYEIAISGDSPSLPAAALGLGGQRPDKLRKAVERAAERGNRLQDRFEVAVIPRAAGG